MQDPALSGSPGPQGQPWPSRAAPGPQGLLLLGSLPGQLFSFLESSLDQACYRTTCFGSQKGAHPYLQPPHATVPHCKPIYGFQ